MLVAVVLQFWLKFWVFENAGCSRVKTYHTVQQNSAVLLAFLCFLYFPLFFSFLYFPVFI